MSTLEMFKSISSCSGKETEFPIVTEEDVMEFHNIIRINDTIKSFYESTNSSTAFFNAFPDIKKVLGNVKAHEDFYAHKLGHSFVGVPNKIVFVLYSLFKETDFKFPNLVVWKASKELSPFLDKVYVSDAGKFTIKDIIDNVYGKSAKIISDSQVKAFNDGTYEVFIEDADRIALFPKDIGDQLSEDDCKKIVYDSKLGLCINELPIRRFNGRLGITFDDFDLREGI